MLLTHNNKPEPPPPTAPPTTAEIVISPANHQLRLRVCFLANERHSIPIVLHACHQSGLDVFHLPESRIVVYDALPKGLSVLAPAALDVDSKCFSGKDLGHLPVVVEAWTENHNVEALPRIGMGESSGAPFLSFVHKDLNLQFIAIHNSRQTFLTTLLQ